ncbi:MAG: hypothetical protein UY40_C0015G0010 [candidate division CPR1 bacterium GW2011_GWC1_49_13]|uniref:Uncharacterized protein n=1 Tax=candidate division CPR1 bacterium GW2011_GWC1_49_13 TaxID=1618342 RepID=A0A0G1YGP0_9BACT|nr:MAG: hypothetical protein UY40_C0015G0010 [candidate division CPR1 bacterium GW2011_GWC1_49_13]
MSLHLPALRTSPVGNFLRAAVGTLYKAGRFGLLAEGFAALATVG